jgi:hypothetical protein
MAPQNLTVEEVAQCLYDTNPHMQDDHQKPHLYLDHDKKEIGINGEGKMTVEEMHKEFVQKVEEIPIDSLIHNLPHSKAGIQAKPGDSDTFMSMFIGLMEYGLLEIREETGMDTSHLSNAIAERLKPLFSSVAVDKNIPEQAFKWAMTLNISQEMMHEFMNGGEKNDR